MSGPDTLCAPSHWQYFRTFAGCHFLLSVIGLAGAVLSLSMGALVGEYFIVLLMAWDAVLMLLYAVMGGWAAGEMCWCAPQRIRDGMGAVLAPALVAWAWGGAFLLAMRHCGGWESARYETLVMILFGSLLIFAFPSSWGYGALCGWVAGRGGLDEPPALLIVGILPPLLFFLGYLWRSRRQAKKQSQTRE